LGGYYGGIRLSYDLFLTNAISILGKADGVDLPLYFRIERPTSMTVQSPTALRSPARLAAERVLESMYREILYWRHAFDLKAISREQLTGQVLAIARRNIDQQTAKALSFESGRLRAVLDQR
jgi:hypothetical protein